MLKLFLPPPLYRKKPIGPGAWELKNFHSQVYSRSSFSLSFIGKALKEKFETPRIYLPSYFCNQSLHYLRELGLDLVFYPIDQNLDPHWEKLNFLVKEKGAPSLFVLTHYFGKVANLYEAKRFCKKNKCLFLEDCAHMMYPCGKMGKFSDFLIFSPHKHIPLPEGGILLAKKGNPLWPILQRNYSDTQSKLSVTFKWLAKAFVFKTLPHKVLDLLYGRKSAPDFFVDPPSWPFSNGQGASLFARELMNFYSKSEVLDLIQKKKENLALLKFSLHILYPEMSFEVIDSETPYSMTLLFKEDKDAQHYFNQLHRDGFSPQSWPDLPGENRDEMATHFRRRIILLPIHPYLNLKSFLKERFKSHGIGENQSFKEVNSEEWSQFLNDFGKVNLLQDDKYGLTKSKISGWSPQHLIFFHQGKPIGGVQALQKKFGPIPLLRINRGPLCINDLPYNKFLILKSFKDAFKRKVMLISPETRGGNESTFLLKHFNFKYLSTKYPGTSWIDLSQSEEQIRGQLKSKWRNSLKTAEKGPFEITHAGEQKDLEWLLELYQKYQSERNFAGPPSSFIRSLFKEKNQNDFLVFRAHLNGELAGSILIVKHYQAATYLIGLSTDLGKKNNANNILLYKAILTLRDLGCHYLDLGGIDPVNTPQIAHFKKGLGGEEIEFVGDWVKVFT